MRLDPTTMPKLLVTGASGFLGWSICQAAQDWQVFGTYHAREVNVPNCRLSKVDITDPVALQQLISTLQPDAVIHTAAISKPNVCQVEPNLSYQINVSASLLLTDLCAEAAIPCVFTSTDQVFSGNEAPYRETDRPNPVNLYGEHKVLAEQGMRQRHSQVSICRLPLMYGVVPHAASFIQPFIQAIKAQEKLQLFVDEVRTPASGDDVAAGLLLALKHRLPLLHLGGPESLTRFEMGQILAEVIGCSQSQLYPCSQSDVSMAATRPANVSLDSTLARSLGFQPRSFKIELQRLLSAPSKNHESS